MRFLYKIYSGYDGFQPAEIENRMEGSNLRLSWKHYIDVVQRGWNCWIYFMGGHNFENGVYIKGTVGQVDLNSNTVILRVREYDQYNPLTSHDVAQTISTIVRPRGRQVFPWPDNLIPLDSCGVTNCSARECDICLVRQRFPLIRSGHACYPSRLRWSSNFDLIAAYWIKPSRCHWPQVSEMIDRISKRFYSFKLGEISYAYPFALAILDQINANGVEGFDCVVPIPLSPDKIAAGEAHRTRELAKELAVLLGIPVRECLLLSKDCSKRKMQAGGHTTSQFESFYFDSLYASVPDGAQHILLVDDVITQGSTAAKAIQALQKVCQNSQVVKITFVAAGQMILRESVLDDAEIIA